MDQLRAEAWRSEQLVPKPLGASNARERWRFSTCGLLKARSEWTLSDSAGSPGRPRPAWPTPPARRAAIGQTGFSCRPPSATTEVSPAVHPATLACLVRSTARRTASLFAVGRVGSAMRSERRIIGCFSGTASTLGAAASQPRRCAMSASTSSISIGTSAIKSMGSPSVSRNMFSRRMPIPSSRR